jgi:hypothetical protein
MRAATMPGFLADRTLYRSRTNYRVSCLSVAFDQRMEGVQPALPNPYFRCIDDYGDTVCCSALVLGSNVFGACCSTAGWCHNIGD